MSEQELNLLQLASRRMAEFRARAPQVVRRKAGKARFCRIQLDDVPNDTLRDAIAPRFTRSSHATEYLARMQVSLLDPLIQDRLDPLGHGSRSNVPTLTNEIDDGSVLFSPLQVRKL